MYEEEAGLDHHQQPDQPNDQTEHAHEHHTAHPKGHEEPDEEVKVPGGQLNDPHPPPTEGHNERHAAAMEHHHVEDFERRFWVCLILTIPVLYYSELIQGLFGYTAFQFPGSTYLPVVLSTVIFFYGGSVFLVGARQELGTLRPGMMTLISLAIVVAYLYSLAAEFVLAGDVLYFELDTLIVIMLLGHWLEMRAIGGARGALAELAKLLPDTAERVIDDHTETVTIDRLRVGDVILVRPGARIAADGEVLQGETAVNEALITGE
jgi:Cu2+-exporting ATPase